MAAATTEADLEQDQPSGSRWRFGPVTLAATLATGLLVGLAIGVLTLRPSPPGDTSAEAGFAREMSTHHSQAVELGMIAYERAESLQVRHLGYDIALAQQAEIGRMRQWLREWNLSPNSSQAPMAWMPDAGELVADEGLMPGMATAEQLTALRKAEGTEVDRLFLELMIRHHLGGLHMIGAVLDQSDHPQVTWLAESQQENHHSELEVLRNLLAEVEEAAEPAS